AVAKALREGASADIRMEAARVLGLLQDRDLAVPALIQALQDTEEKVRILSAEALSRHESNAKAAIPALEKALTDPSRGVRDAAAKAIREIEGMGNKKA